MRDTDKVSALEERAASGDRLFSPSSSRNKVPIADAFAALALTSGHVLEIASGTGEHGVHLCGRYPGLTWQPSDPDEGSRRSETAWASAVPGGRLRAPLDLDVSASSWWATVPERPDVVYCANMIHIAPWTAAEGLMRGAAALLGGTGALVLYGPFSRRGAMTEGNRRFDASLRARDPAFGVRDLDDAVQPLAARHGLALARVLDMPTGNLIVAFEPN